MEGQGVHMITEWFRSKISSFRMGIYANNYAK